METTIMGYIGIIGPKKSFFRSLLSITVGEGGGVEDPALKKYMHEKGAAYRACLSGPLEFLQRTRHPFGRPKPEIVVSIFFSIVIKQQVAYSSRAVKLGFVGLWDVS